ncbi:MAG TPA: 30S ribosomal protein S16 [Natronosporangium sp.]
MAVRIRLMRMGKIRNPQYRIVVADSRTKRDGKAIENLGIYHPKEEPSRIEVNSERVQYWLSVGAQPSDPVLAILRKTGDWQKFKGLTPPANPVKVAPAKADRRAIYEAEAKAAAGLADKPGKGEADQPPAKKAAKKTAKKAAKSAEKPADAPAASGESAEAPAAEPAAEPPAENNASEQS